MAVEFIRYLDKSIKYLHRQGAFLTVKKGDEVNVSTISWGNIGFEWGRPVFTILVRSSRHNHELLQDNVEFTVSIPTTSTMKKALNTVGSLSGRDTDKWAVANLTPYKAKTMETPVVKEANIFYECRIIYNHKVDPKLLRGDVDVTSYMDGDYHEIFYGEIVTSYTKDDL
ncbi:flavin reductase family protein [Proteiniclasticum sp.]|uniref:flavin reductase family protein n=1 Tax=Proteiniclasticum sp. TaxID=2053595 RepID=UPI0028A132CB|nr:flavin reductase family protein [Proteiniclasticum sp.]